MTTDLECPLCSGLYVASIKHVGDPGYPGMTVCGDRNPNPWHGAPQPELEPNSEEVERLLG